MVREPNWRGGRRGGGEGERGRGERGEGERRKGRGKRKGRGRKGDGVSLTYFQFSRKILHSSVVTGGRQLHSD